MAFSKSFPRTIKGTTYPVWEEVFLSEKEEKEIEEMARKENIELMKQCIEEAKKIVKDKGLKTFQNDTINMAIALFEKRASHVVFWKESKCKEKLDDVGKES